MNIITNNPSRTPSVYSNTSARGMAANKAKFADSENAVATFANYIALQTPMRKNRSCGQNWEQRKH